MLNKNIAVFLLRDFFLSFRMRPRTRGGGQPASGAASNDTNESTSHRPETRRRGTSAAPPVPPQRSRSRTSSCSSSQPDSSLPPNDSNQPLIPDDNPSTRTLATAIADLEIIDEDGGHQAGHPRVSDDEDEHVVVPTRAPSPAESDTGVAPLPAPSAPSALSTADIDPFFERGNKTTGSKALCKICRDDPPTGKGRLTWQYAASMSTGILRSHMERLHVDKYEEHCQQNGLQPSLSRHKNPATEAPGVPRDNTPFSIAGLHERLVQFIVADDQSLNVVECPEFRDLIFFLQQDLKDTDLPH
ncbi:hypothetical protein C8J56DRAFT_1160450 [Mycena floridula]|nr:hypothetical protein C8J56DRAFT_1160450 [Mycena floridula]